MKRVGLIVGAVLVLGGCRDGHGHGHGHEHGHGHGEEGYQHAHEHPEGHDHHAAGHGHGKPVVGITRWSERFELFAEHEPALTGEPFELLVHLTVLDGFRALSDASIRLELEGPAAAEARAETPIQPGIYRLETVPPKPGTYTARLIVEGDGGGTIDGFDVVVHEHAQAAEAAGDGEHHEEDEESINFLKEQQWKMDFATAFAERGEVVPSVQVPGTVATPPGGLAEVSAPIAGRVVAPAGGLPRPGQQVKAGELLAHLAPAPSSAEGAGRARLAVVEAEARLTAARSNAERAQRLIADEAISRRELEEAQREVEVARESVKAARDVAALFAGARAGRGNGRWRLTAPIAGVVASTHANPGASVSPEDVLFRIVNRQELWLTARVPEQDAARLQPSRGGSFRLSGLTRWTPLVTEGEGRNATLVTVSPEVNPRTRAVEVVFALEQPEGSLRVGGLLTLELPIGDPWRGLVVPRGAIVEEGGRKLVYVQLDGEHFEERPVRTGPASGNRIGIVDGLRAGERVVSTGGNLLRLSSRSKGQQPHGHVH